MSDMLLQAALMGLYVNKSPAESKKMSLKDLKPEYNLIKAKKSKLSANQRRLVVNKYERLIKGDDNG